MNYNSPKFPAAQAREREPQREIERRKKLRPSDVIARAATVELLRQQIGPNHLEARADVLERIYGGCPATSYYLKAATNPASSTTATWAAELIDQSMADFLANDMARQSAFAALSAQALTVSLPVGAGAIKIPARTSPAALAGGWIGEGAAKMVYQGSLAATTLTPNKLACLTAFSEEMLDCTEIETILREVLAHDLSALLDQTLLDATASSATRPAGLWNGATAVTASAATPPSEAMMVDLRALHTAVATNNPDANVVYIINPAQALRINITAPEYDNLIVSGYQPAGSLGAVDASAIAMLLGLPEFALSRSASLHMEGAAPLPLSATGSPNVMSAPVRSMFQEDACALRTVLRTGWAKRRAGATAIIASGVTW